MKILVLYPFLPYPPVSGTRLRGSSILDILAHKYEVSLVSFVGRDESTDSLPSWKTYNRFAREPLTIPRRQVEELTSAGRNLRAMVPKSRFGVPEWLSAFDSAAMWNCIAGLDIKQFDAVHVRYAFMVPYALALKRAVPHLRLVVDLDDVPSVVALRKLGAPKGISRLREYLWEVRELLRTYSFESESLRFFDSVWVCSKVDLRKISRRIGAERALIVHNVVDADRLASIGRQDDGPALLFIGDFNYFPNRQGAEFFVKSAWPKVRAGIPDAQLLLVGANRQEQMLGWNGQDGIVVTGTVDDVAPYLKRATVSIAPLLMGAGTRLKILEALGAGLPVVSTTIGAEGIEATNGVHFLIADAPEEFASCCLEFLQDPALRDRFSQAGKSLIREKYDISGMSRVVLGCYDALGHGIKPKDLHR